MWRGKIQYWGVFLGFLFQSFSFSSDVSFYRIIEGANPGPAQQVVDEFLHGSKVLYTEDVKNGPIKVDGIVWHPSLKYMDLFQGTRNPVTENLGYFKELEDNKWEESKLLMKYAPEYYPRTENLGEVLRSLEGPPPTLAQWALLLKIRYPNGFFLKPVQGFNSVGTFPDEKMDFAGVYERYLKNVLPRMNEFFRETQSTDSLHLQFKETPDYEGRVLEEVLKNPESVIVQEKMKPRYGSTIQTSKGPKKLIEEYRIHIVEGKVLQGASVNRWEDALSFSQEHLEKAELTAQKVVDLLPIKYRKLSFGMDIFVTENGEYKVIELNTGGESGYLNPETSLWITQLLASHYLGRPTPLLTEIQSLRDQTELSEIGKILGALFSHPEIKSLGTIETNPEPFTEILELAKNRILKIYTDKPSLQNAKWVLALFARYKLRPYLTSQEVTLTSQFLGCNLLFM